MTECANKQRLTPAERTLLLQMARAAIEDAVRQSDALRPLIKDCELTPGLLSTCGVFVSLKKQGLAATGRGELRGCIGNVASSKPLYRNLADIAPKSALEDPRFPPLTAAELGLVQIEISVLTPLEELRRVEDLVIGRDGLQLTKGSRRALFLPQVAVEAGWKRQELLENLALKAGLERSGWKGAKFHVFRAEHFSE